MSGSSVRYLIAVLLFLLIFISRGSRMLLSIAIGQIAIEYNYTNTQKGLLLGAVFLGDIFPQVPAGWLARRVGGWPVLVIASAISSLGILLTPICASSFGALFFMRFLSGLGGGVIFPVSNAIVVPWVPVTESSAFIGFIWSGGFIGIATVLASSGVIMSLALPGNVWTGWVGIFYIWGIISVGITVLWAALGTSSPEVHWGVSASELAYIQKSRARVGSPFVAVPWDRLFRNRAVVALVISYFCHEFHYYLLFAWIPEFIRTQLHYGVRSVGFLSLAPYLGAFVLSLAGGFVATALLARGFSRTHVRKGFVAVGEWVAIIAIALVGWVPSAGGMVALLVLGVSFCALATSAYATNHVDVAPQYASLTLAVSNTAASLAGAVSPMILGHLIEQPHDDLAHWRAAFFLSSTVVLVGWALFAAFGSGARISQLDELDDERGLRGGQRAGGSDKSGP